MKFYFTIVSLLLFSHLSYAGFTPLSTTHLSLPNNYFHSFSDGQMDASNTAPDLCEYDSNDSHKEIIGSWIKSDDGPETKFPAKKSSLQVVATGGGKGTIKAQNIRYEITDIESNFGADYTSFQLWQNNIMDKAITLNKWININNPFYIKQKNKADFWLTRTDKKNTALTNKNERVIIHGDVQCSDYYNGKDHWVGKKLPFDLTYINEWASAAPKSDSCSIEIIGNNIIKNGGIAKLRVRSDSAKYASKIKIHTTIIKHSTDEDFTLEAKLEDDNWLDITNTPSNILTEERTNTWRNIDLKGTDKTTKIGTFHTIINVSADCSA